MFPKIIKVAGIQSKNLFEYNTSTSGQLKLSGVDGKFLDMMSKHFKFKVEIVVPPEKEWGTTVNGRWTGMVGVVHRNEADIAVCQIAVTEPRYKAVDYSTCYDAQAKTFATEPPGFLPTTTSFLYPFNLNVWMCSFAAIVLVSLTFRYILSRKQNVLRILIELLGVILRQPFQTEVVSRKDALLYQSWFFFAFFLSASYTAVLHSFLTFPLRERGVETVQDLADEVKRGNFKSYVARGSSDLDLFLHSDQPHLKLMGEAMKKNQWLFESSKGIAGHSFDSRTAVIGPQAAMYLAFGKEPYSTKKISKDILTVNSVGVIIRRGFCCKEDLNYFILSMLSGGLYQKIYDDQLFPTRFKLHVDHKEIKPLDFKDIISTFLILIFGYILSLVVLIGEIVSWKQLKKPKKSKRSFRCQKSNHRHKKF